MTLLFAFGGLWLVDFLGSASAFDLSARSEIVHLITGCRTQPRWILQNASVQADGRELAGFAGQVEVGPRARVRIERVGAGPLRVMVQRADELPEGCDASDTRPLGVLTHVHERRDDGVQVVDPVEESVDASLVIEVATSESSAVMLPFVAWAEVGQSLKSATRTEAPILTSGRVTFLRTSFLRFGRGLPHTAGATALSPGDRFFVPTQREPGFGFARVDEDAGLLVGYRATGRQAEIERFGMRGYAIRPTMAEAFAGDSSVQLVMALLGAVAGLAQTLSAIRLSRASR